MCGVALALDGVSDWCLYQLLFLIFSFMLIRGLIQFRGGLLLGCQVFLHDLLRGTNHDLLYQLLFARMFGVVCSNLGVIVAFHF